MITLVGDSITSEDFSDIAGRSDNTKDSADNSLTDSIVQDRMPHPVIHWSSRLDTLSIPGIKRHSLCDFNNLPVCYLESFFNGNPHYHPELPFRHHGYIAEPISYRLWRDDLVSSLLIIIFVLLTILIKRSGTFIREQSHDFLYTPHFNQTVTSVTTSLEYGTRTFLTFVLSLIGGLCFFSYIQTQYTVFLGQLSPYFLLTLYTILFMMFFSVKRVMLDFVNWIFFDKIRRYYWNQSYNFLYMIETLCLLPCVAIFIYFHISFSTALMAVAFVIVSIKVLLLYKTYQIFFPKLYGFLHLLSYLCALEIMPIIALWVLLTNVTDNMIVKF